MAISPIAIATQGVLNSPLAVAAVRGHLTIETDVTTGGGLGYGAYGILPPDRWEHPQLEIDRIELQIEREEEEIMAIVVSAAELLKWHP